MFKKITYIIICFLFVHCGSSGTSDGGQTAPAEALFGDWDIQLIGQNTGNCPGPGQSANQDISIDEGESSPVRIKISKGVGNNCEIEIEDGLVFINMENTEIFECTVNGSTATIKYKGTTHFDDWDLNGGDCTQSSDVTFTFNLDGASKIKGTVSGQMREQGVCAQADFGVNDKSCTGKVYYQGTKAADGSVTPGVQEQPNQPEDSAWVPDPVGQVPGGVQAPNDGGVNAGGVADQSAQAGQEPAERQEDVELPVQPNPINQDNQRQPEIISQPGHPQITECVSFPIRNTVKITFNESIFSDADASFSVLSNAAEVNMGRTRVVGTDYFFSLNQNVFESDKKYKGTISGIRDSDLNRRENMTFDFEIENNGQCALSRVDQGDEVRSCFNSVNGVFKWQKCGGRDGLPNVGPIKPRLPLLRR